MEVIADGWRASEGLVKAESNLGYLSNEDNRNDLPLPRFELNGCPRHHLFPTSLLEGCEQLKDVDNKITAALRALDYETHSYYYAPNGFALLTPIEQIRSDGTALEGVERWQDFPAGSDFEGILAYLASLVQPQHGYFRLFVFVVADRPIRNSGGDMGADEAKEWLKDGGGWLPPEIGNRLLTANHKISVYIYEFKAPESTKIIAEECDPFLTIREHLNRSGLQITLRK